MKNVFFFGTDENSLIVLDKLSRSGIGITAVITTQSIPQKKRAKIITNPVEEYAKTHNFNTLYYPPKIDKLSKLINKDTIGISASFGRILSTEILALFPNGIYNLHPSLLPQYRNVAPVPYALAMGDTVTGISIFRMDEKVDNGQIIAQVSERILPGDSTPILLRRLFSLGSNILISFLQGSEPCSYKVRNLVTTDRRIFTRKLSRESGFIEWLVFQKYLTKQALAVSDTVNPLISLRLTHFPSRNDAGSIISDLLRALTGYEKLWTTTPQGINVFITSLTPLMLHLPGKPKPISFSDFQKYYL